MGKLISALAAALLLAPLAAKADSEFSVVLEGGATHYNQGLSNGTETGGGYGARLGIMPTPIVGVEIGYLGSQNNVSQSFNAGHNVGTLRTNGGYADLRVNVLPGVVTPYVFGGYGLTHFDAPGDSTSFNALTSTTTSTIPFGGGLEANIGAFKVGGRFQYNYLFDHIYTGTGRSGAGVNVVKGGNADFYAVSLDLGASFR